MNRLFSNSRLLVAGLGVLALCFWASAASAQIPLPSLRLDVGSAENPEEVASAIQILGLLTVLSLAPTILILMTCFTRLMIVFGFLRQALGTQQLPPNQVLIGLSLFLTVFVMQPVLTEIHERAWIPYADGQITQAEGLQEAQKPIRSFMLRQTREKDLALFASMKPGPRPANAEELGLTELVPAFVVSELRIAFQIGFMLYLPFLIIDMVVAMVLMSMGMMMLPPVMISLPIKLLLFVLTDGWNLIVQSMVSSFT